MEEIVNRIHELEDEDGKSVNSVVVSNDLFKEFLEGEKPAELTEREDGLSEFYGYKLETARFLGKEERPDFYVAYETGYGTCMPSVEQVESFAEEVPVKNFFDREAAEHRYYVNIFLPVEKKAETVVYTSEDDVHEDDNVHPHRDKGVTEFDNPVLESVNLKLAASLDDEVVSDDEQDKANERLGFEPKKEIKSQLRKMVRNEILRGAVSGEFSKPVMADRVYTEEDDEESEEFRIGKRVLEFDRLMLSDGIELPESVTME